MQDYFWNEAGRAKWKTPDPSVVHFGDVFLRLGKVKYKADWTGADKWPPDDDQIEALQEIMRNAGALGVIRTSVFDSGSLEFIEVPPKTWRNFAATAARFSVCKMDCKDLDGNVPDSKRHGLICVDARDVEKLMAHADLSRIRLEEENGALPDGFVSTYLHFLVHMAKTLALDVNSLPTSKVLEATLRKEWLNWRLPLSGGKELPPHAHLTDRLLKIMSLMLRGEAARFKRIGGHIK